MTEGESESPSARPMGRATEIACYATGFFSLGLVPMMSLVVPLWAISLDATPFVIGLIVGIRSVLPLLLSIHGGVVMDRLGIRRIMFWLAAICIVLVSLYPMLPWISALLALQLVFGLAQGLSWVGAQTQIGRLTRGNPRHSGRFSFASTAGTFVAPLIAGIAWDRAGATGAFLTVGVWCLALWISIHFLPRAEGATPVVPDRPAWRALTPRVEDYLAAARLLAVPAVGLVAIATFVRIGTISVQGSFYTVYLESIDFPATVIGILIATSSVAGSFAALLNGPLSPYIRQSWILVGAIGLAIVAIGLTPTLTSFGGLTVLAVLFGVGIGLTLPPILSILSVAAGPERQGLGVGLRTTANRLASLVVPVAMGAAADLFGLQGAFLATAAALALILAVMGRQVCRHRL